MRKLLMMLLVVAGAGCEPVDPSLWMIDLPRTGTTATGQVTCGLEEFTSFQLTVMDPLGSPYIAGDPAWACFTNLDDSVICTKYLETVEGQTRSTFNIVPARLIWSVFFANGTACTYYFGG